MTLIIMIMILIGFPCDPANTVNNDNDDEWYYDDDGDDAGAPGDVASTVDTTDDCGNEHDDKVKTFSLCMHGSW